MWAPLQLVDQIATGPVAAAAVAVNPERAPSQQRHVVRQRRVRDRVVVGEQRPVRRQLVQERRPSGSDDLAELVVLLDHEHHPGHLRRWPPGCPRRRLPGRLPGRVAQGRRGGMDRRAQALHRLRRQQHQGHHGRQQHPAQPVATGLAGPAGDEDRQQPGDPEGGASDHVAEPVHAQVEPRQSDQGDQCGGPSPGGHPGGRPAGAGEEHGQHPVDGGGVGGVTGGEREAGGMGEGETGGGPGAFDQLLDRHLDDPGAGGGPGQQRQRTPAPAPPAPRQPGRQDQRHEHAGGAEVGDQPHDAGQPPLPVGDEERRGVLVDQAGGAGLAQQPAGQRPHEDQPEQGRRQRRHRRRGGGEGPARPPPATGPRPAAGGHRNTPVWPSE